MTKLNGLSKRKKPRSILAICSIVSVLSTPAWTEETKVFSIHRGVNVAGPFVGVLPQAGPDGQVSRLIGNAGAPNQYGPADLIKLGYDFIRIPVNPAPLLENPPVVRDRMLNEIEDGIRAYLAVGLHVIFDLHFWSPPNKLWTPAYVVGDMDGLGFAAYRGLVRDIAARLAHYPYGDVAVELMNEPPASNYQPNRWGDEQRLLLKEVRDIAPTLPIVVTGYGGQLDGLLSLRLQDIDVRDKNLIFTFHFYEPFLFTHQGYPGYPYIGGLPYPPPMGSMTDALNITIDLIDAAKLSTEDARAAKTRTRKQIDRYFAHVPSSDVIERRLDAVMVWAHANEIAASQLLLGEFAAINWRKTDTPQYLASRIRWDEDVQSAAEKRGIATAYWNLPPRKGRVFR
jgi:hypothetical protein